MPVTLQDMPIRLVVLELLVACVEVLGLRHEPRENEQPEPWAVAIFGVSRDSDSNFWNLWLRNAPLCQGPAFDCLWCRCAVAGRATVANSEPIVLCHCFW